MQIKLKFSSVRSVRLFCNDLELIAQGMRTFYNRIVILAQGEGGKEEEYQVLVKCQLESPEMEHLDENDLNSTVSRREKRDILPAGFQEPE